MPALWSGYAALTPIRKSWRMPATGCRRSRLYRVRFAQRELWPDYVGSAADTVDVEIYQHWLEPAEANRP